MTKEGFSGIARAAAWGLVLGGGIGFAMGMLLAPEEGQKLRRRLAFQLENASADIGKVIERLSTPAESSEARQKAASLVADVEERAKQIKNEMDELIQRYPSRRQASSSN